MAELDADTEGDIDTVTLFETSGEFDALNSEEDVLEIVADLESDTVVVSVKDWRTERVTDGE